MNHPGKEEPVGDQQPRRADSSTPVTIAYIAETAGVSVPTVSKVINGRSGVAADTRARVEALITEYGYRRPAPVLRSALTDPPLTTVHQPLTEMAVAATELALALGRGEKPAQLGVELATTLKIRNSTAPPAG